MCREPLPVELAVLPCGHPLCHACTLRLIDRGAASRVRFRVWVSGACLRSPVSAPPSLLVSVHVSAVFVRDLC